MFNCSVKVAAKSDRVNEMLGVTEAVNFPSDGFNFVNHTLGIGVSFVQFEVGPDPLQRTVEHSGPRANWLQAVVQCSEIRALVEPTLAWGKNFVHGLIPEVFPMEAGLHSFVGRANPRAASGAILSPHIHRTTLDLDKDFLEQVHAETLQMPLDSGLAHPDPFGGSRAMDLRDAMRARKNLLSLNPDLVEVALSQLLTNGSGVDVGEFISGDEEVVDSLNRHFRSGRDSEAIEKQLDARKFTHLRRSVVVKPQSSRLVPDRGPLARLQNRPVRRYARPQAMPAVVGGALA